MSRYLAAVVMVTTAMTPVAAEVYTVHYTGTVTSVSQYPTGDLLPADVFVGAPVEGDVVIDTGRAADPVYTYTSCSGSCGGDGVTATFNLAGHVSHTLVIGANTWPRTNGQVYLQADSTDPVDFRQAMGLSDGDSSGRDWTLQASFAAPLNTTDLFPDLNTLADLRFDLATGGSGTLRPGGDALVGYYVAFDITTPTAEVTPSPGSGGGGSVGWLVVGVLGGLAFARRRRHLGGPAAFSQRPSSAS
ncbi:MAG: hypothetical protein J0M16_06395 [Gammaproteobacteria bacterium]|jgi:MYXO-CTERM domain-containing protein|nr:hypothetical protein [Gammaproteobacteria bacterium]